MKQVKNQPKTQGDQRLFVGRGNTQEEALRVAEAKCNAWVFSERSVGTPIHGVQKSIEFTQVNAVYWRCELRVDRLMEDPSKNMA